jgi:pimeloyl-ACP methyl ester carboxylesterase
VVAVFFGVQLVFGTAFGYVITHRVRSSVHETTLGRAHEDVSLTTSDGLELFGWYVPSRNRAAVIVFPGRGGNPAAHARMLARHGYGALLFDNRGHGVSGTHGQGGEDMNPQYYALAGEPKELWEIGDGKHVGGLEARPAEYERRVIEFFDQALLPKS